VAIQAEEQVSPFDQQARAESAKTLLFQAAGEISQKNLDAAQKLCERATQMAPFWSDSWYHLAVVQALAGDRDQALANLKKAIDSGFDNVVDFERNDAFKGLRGDRGFMDLRRQLARSIRQQSNEKWPQKSKSKQQVATASLANSDWDQRTGLLRFAFELPAEEVRRIAGLDSLVVNGNGDEIDRQLTDWYRSGEAAGNIGDFYDNCDRDHSTLLKEQFPQLTFIEYGADIPKPAVYGLQLSRFYNQVVIGNASTALTAGPAWRSNVRSALTLPRGPQILAFQYQNNHLYFYPEHKDYDPGHNGAGGGYGDLYSANTPYVVISQGSSGSDLPFLRAFACTLAAFRPDVKKKLIAEKAIAPALQQIFRRANKVVKSPEEYLTGIAHPTVFDSFNLDPARMIQLAHDMTLETLPPIARIRMVSEETPRPGIDYFAPYDEERLFDSPSAIARLWRSTQQKRTYVLSAEPSRDLTGQALKFHWVLLRGDPEGVEITPLDASGREAKVTLTWQARRPITPGSLMQSNRIDIGVFADNGKAISAPAFFCVNTVDSEIRRYDDAGRIQSVIYTGDKEKGNYVDPALCLAQSWMDEYRYAADGTLLGWTRSRGKEEEEFTADGAVVQKRDSQGRPLVARTVRYETITDAGKQLPVIRQVSGPERLHYSYAGNRDQRGTIQRQEITAE